MCQIDITLDPEPVNVLMLRGLASSSSLGVDLHADLQHGTDGSVHIPVCLQGRR